MLSWGRDFRREPVGGSGSAGKKSAARKKSLDGVHEVAGGLRFRNVAVCACVPYFRFKPCGFVHGEIRTRVERSSLPISRAASKPLMPGMDPSRTTTWGCRDLMATIASLALEASPQTSQFFPDLARRVRIPSRTISWSPTGRILGIHSGGPQGAAGTATA